MPLVWNLNGDVCKLFGFFPKIFLFKRETFQERFVKLNPKTGAMVLRIPKLGILS